MLGTTLEIKRSTSAQVWPLLSWIYVLADTSREAGDKQPRDREFKMEKRALQKAPECPAMAPKHAHILIPRPVTVTLYGRRDPADVTDIMDLEMGRLS